MCVWVGACILYAYKYCDHANRHPYDGMLFAVESSIRTDTFRCAQTVTFYTCVLTLWNITKRRMPYVYLHLSLRSSCNPKCVHARYTEYDRSARFLERFRKRRIRIQTPRLCVITLHRLCVIDTCVDTYVLVYS